MTDTTHQKYHHLFIILAGIFITNAIVAEIIGAKIFSGEAFLNLPPAQIPLINHLTLDFNLSAGVVIWPVVFVISDIINEYFGKAGVKKISIITAFLIAYTFLVIYFTTQLPPAAFWQEINKVDIDGNPLNINNAFSAIFRQGMGIMLGSITAFFIGQLLDAHTFQWIKSVTGSKKLWLRATGSTLISQLVDSFVVLFIAFYLFGNWNLEQIVSVGIINYIYKFIVAILLTPLLYIIHYIIDSYLNPIKTN
jgi:uncharacterized integral membrane protein (TIGR00697 family)